MLFYFIFLISLEVVDRKVFKYIRVGSLVFVVSLVSKKYEISVSPHSS